MNLQGDGVHMGVLVLEVDHGVVTDVGEGMQQGMDAYALEATERPLPRRGRSSCSCSSIRARLPRERFRHRFGFMDLSRREHSGVRKPWSS